MQVVDIFITQNMIHEQPAQPQASSTTLKHVQPEFHLTTIALTHEQPPQPRASSTTLKHVQFHRTRAKKDSKEEKIDGKEDPKPDASFPSFAVIAIALIVMGEDIGAEMSLRQFNHLVSDYNSFFYSVNLRVQRCFMANPHFG
jgi:hypothetical protein